jgi:hypothetical protein
VTIDPRPQETSWSTPLDEDEEHATYDPDHVGSYFAAAVRASLALAEVRAPYRGRSTPVNAWWGSFDLAVNLFSGQPADPPSEDFIMRNAMDAQEVAVGWWPGDERYPRAAFYGYAHPAPRGYQDARLEPPQARWEPALGEFVLDWEDVRGNEDPHRAAVSFARSVIRLSCSACDWEPALAASVDGVPPRVSTIGTGTTGSALRRARELEVRPRGARCRTGQRGHRPGRRTRWDRPGELTAPQRGGSPVVDGVPDRDEYGRPRCSQGALFLRSSSPSVLPGLPEPPGRTDIGRSARPERHRPDGAEVGSA